MTRDPFSAWFEYRRRYISDRWWLTGGVLVVAGGALVSAVSAAGWLVILLGLAVLLYGLTVGRNRAQ